MMPSSSPEPKAEVSGGAENDDVNSEGETRGAFDHF
jgi:hypothetical protein